MNKDLKEILNIKYPIILAPMFLVTNVKMVQIALDSGITGAIPAMNFRTEKELYNAIIEIKEHSNKAFGINLICNKSNSRYKKQLSTILNAKPHYIISSLGNPKDLINKAKKEGIKVFCDVTDVSQAIKVEKLGADAVVAVNSDAGGHSGKYREEELISEIKTHCKIPIISAGGISNKEKLKKSMTYDIAGVSIGTVFIASNESPVSQEYKKALVDYTANDIIMTTKLSGVPSTVINTDYVKSIGTKQNILEKIIYSSPKLKKYAKSILMKKGMNKLKNAAFKATYKKVWCAGKSIEDINIIKPLSEIIKDFTVVFDEI